MWATSIRAALERGWSVLALAGLSLSSACGAATDEPASVQTSSQNLEVIWRSEWRDITASPNGLFSAAACAAQSSGYEAVAMDKSTFRYRVWVYESAADFGPWRDLGTQTFVSKPTCAALRGLDASSHIGGPDQFIVLGRKSNNTYAASVWRVAGIPQPQTPPGAPSLVSNWAEIGATTYASAPAATVANGKITVVGRKSDNRLYLTRSTLQNGLTYNNTWTTPVQLPALPSPWIVRGNPAIAPLIPQMDQYAVVVRAQNGSTGPMTLFYLPWVGFAPANWGTIPVGPEGVASDPAVEFTSETDLDGNFHDWNTVYYRGNNNGISHLTGQGNFDAAPIRLLQDTFVEDPAAVGNMQLESHHLVLAKESADGAFFFLGGNFSP